jgi:hypothetical protein
MQTEPLTFAEFAKVPKNIILLKRQELVILGKDNLFFYVKRLKL